MNHQSAKTHCCHGHAYADNLVIQSDGTRRCRECHRINQRRQNERRRLGLPPSVRREEMPVPDSPGFDLPLANKMLVEALSRYAANNNDGSARVIREAMERAA